MPEPLLDARSRPLHYLRISVTDRCNFRCRYCMPREVFGHDHKFLPRRELLTFEEIERLARVFASLGVHKIRITGGEPLLRREVEHLVALLPAVPGIDELAMTTNGALLAAKAAGLAAAGLHRITVSLDSLDDAAFRTLSDTETHVAEVLAGIDAASAAGLPVKINAVVKRGINENGIVALARHFKDGGHVLRFVEYMDVGHSNGWRLDDVVPAGEILAAIDAELPIEAVAGDGGVACRYRYRDGSGEIGIIASVTQPFCGTCSRARLSADGVLYTCLFATTGHSLRDLLRNGSSDADIEAAVRSIWAGRADHYSEIRSASTVNLPKVEMSYIGG